MSRRFGTAARIYYSQEEAVTGEGEEACGRWLGPGADGSWIDCNSFVDSGGDIDG